MLAIVSPLGNSGALRNTKQAVSFCNSGVKYSIKSGFLSS